jgi:transposase
MLKQQAAELVDVMVALIQSDACLCSWYAEMVQIAGIARQSAAQILAETAVLPLDMTARQWTASAGLDPRARQSGQCNPPQHISRMGNRYLRRVLYMAAINTTQFDPDVKRYYAYLQALGKPKKLALTIIMRKLLQAFWVMQHRNQPFLARKSFSVPAK